METRIYTLQNGVLTNDGISNNLHGHPDIKLYCPGNALTRDEILKLFSIENAKIHAYASYDVTAEGQAETPDYFIYEIFLDEK